MKEGEERVESFVLVSDAYRDEITFQSKLLITRINRN